MKKTIIITAISITSLIILAKLGFFESLMMFVLVGAIPGTSYTIPSTFMLLSIISIIWLLVLRFTAFEVFQSVSTKRTAKKRHVTQKKRMPKRRFEQVKLRA